jgi:hypothetical protein
MLPPQLQLLYASALCPHSGCTHEATIKLVNQGGVALQALLVLTHAETDATQQARAEALVLDARTLQYDGSTQGSSTDPKLVDNLQWEPLQVGGKHCHW